ncbi:porin family protein [Aquimarina sp. RZ0]|uniref:porin family protein n=1 Tax=Aquimarina sp. RZ0 TaxID=2607730 RepID=UPI0011F26718|nr:porin family protein [Aquimarina sp. RZ0]KAA1246149.1 PorT family protein [Aquimarina sp. RZ0]
MKKLFLLIIAITGFSSVSNAQNIKLGFKAGVNFSDIKSTGVTTTVGTIGDGSLNNQNIDVDSKTGYHFGAVAEVEFSSRFSLQPEIMYSAQGAKDIDLDYVNIPILAKFKFLKIISIEFGPQFSVNVNDDDIENIESLDVGAAAGLSVKFRKLFGQIRYNFGVIDIAENVDAKNSNFQISVGYYIL